MELISPVLRMDFREFCVSQLYLRQIEDIFIAAGFSKGQLPEGRKISGQRRTMVEEFYIPINWSNVSEAEKFLTVLNYALAQRGVPEEEIERIHKLSEKCGLSIINLQISFKRGTAATSSNVEQNFSIDPAASENLKDKLIKLYEWTPQQRGFEFEKFLNELFTVYNLKPRASFRLVGEQIDGSFELNNNTYLFEAKWQQSLTGQNDLLILREKVESKSTWGRGLFLSHSGFTEEALEAFQRGRATNIIGMTGEDLFFILNGEISLSDAITKKERHAAETGEFFIRIFTLLRS